MPIPLGGTLVSQATNMRASDLPKNEVGGLAGDLAHCISDPTFFLESSDGELVEISRRILDESSMMKQFYDFFDDADSWSAHLHKPGGGKEDICGSLKNPFPLPSLSSRVLKKLAAWIDFHADRYQRWQSTTTEFLRGEPEQQWRWKGLGRETVEFLHDDVFFELFRAAEFLELHSLSVVCSKYCLCLLEKQTTDELRRRYKMERDLTVEEEEEIGDRILRVQTLQAEVDPNETIEVADPDA